MTSENVATGGSTLHYTLTTDDLLDGLAAQSRNFHTPWYLRWPTTLVAPLAVATVVVESVLAGEFSTVVALAVGALLVVLMPVVMGVDFLLRRFLRNPRLIYRLHLWLLVRANPALTQPMTATVSEAGVRVWNVSGEMSSGWSMHPLHVETGRSFVLLASRRRGAAMLVLPKRGLDGADPAPLRALLAAHSGRLG
ncbi:hypothetical protein GCM10022225_11790 [Plantactinospora mayteni]|uniref:YcxB-like protein domain-containing protein n=1 Tax=Plantactinospora mayteni TaxID=566021 RepID=A0ABQ4EHE1_9ACTN|nr:hypothetical protein [Plantactinospora mayteni]GIG94069.1 hypothetical protein Pma05_06420 [Plantactinospora mayteni]